MKRLAVPTFAVLVTAFLATRAPAEHEAESRGAVFSHVAVEEFEMPVGLTASGRPRRDTRLGERREELIVPEHFGKLLDMTAAGEDVVFWYQDEAGLIRNAVIPDPAHHMYRVRRRPTARFTVEEPR